jgi:hypothetical protein
MRAAHRVQENESENREMMGERGKLLEDARKLRVRAKGLGFDRHQAWDLPPSIVSATVSATTATAATTTTVLGTTITTTTATTAATPSSTSVTTATGGSVIPAGITPTASASTASATTEASSTVAERALMRNGLKPSRCFLVCLAEELDKVTNDVLVATIEEGSGNTSVTGATSTTDTVNVIINVRWEVKVDNVGNVGDIKTTSSHGGGNHDRSMALTECLEGHLTLPLGSVTVDGCGRVVVGDEVVGKYVSHPLSLDEDKSQATPRLHGKDVQEDGAFVKVLDVLDFLGDIFGGGANPADGEEDVLFEEILG